MCPVLLLLLPLLLRLLPLGLDVWIGWKVGWIVGWIVGGIVCWIVGRYRRVLRLSRYSYPSTNARMDSWFALHATGRECLSAQGTKFIFNYYHAYHGYNRHDNN